MIVEGSAVPPVAGTREDVHVTGRRILATIVDGLLLGLLFAVMAALFGTITKTDAFGWDASMPAIPTVVYVLLVVFYYVLLEGYVGQTVGKMLFGIKVLREGAGGRAPSLRAAVIRTALRMVDGLLGYGVAFVTVLVSGKNQRLGDMAARTLVVRS
ncbi:RDD family protein [Rubrobacter tropicus]|uniref:RDD family protein n=1 Tax=Rubrobacter tropicus TaxID=2653851 RepID=A0A6G8QDN5_9ACTN|nr:RDD family protein [Rubrobacter tropicus]QIN84548.1 RDD family protein [Rubrobacter tropicus]